MADLPFFPKNYAEHERHTIDNADRFVACDFRGRATFAKVERSTQEAAERAARTLIAQRTNPHSKGRPVLVYAICGVHQVVAATVYP